MPDHRLAPPRPPCPARSERPGQPVLRAGRGLPAGYMVLHRTAVTPGADHTGPGRAHLRDHRGRGHHGGRRPYQAGLSPGSEPQMHWSLRPVRGHHGRRLHAGRGHLPGRPGGPRPASATRRDEHDRRGAPTRIDHRVAIAPLPIRQLVAGPTGAAERSCRSDHHNAVDSADLFRRLHAPGKSRDLTPEDTIFAGKSGGPWGRNSPTEPLSAHPPSLATAGPDDPLLIATGRSLVPSAANCIRCELATMCALSRPRTTTLGLTSAR